MWNIEKIISKGDYNYCKTYPQHPKATIDGYVLHHRVVVENHLNRILNANEVVHHINGNKKDNRIENLEIMGRKEHSYLHAVKGRKMITLKCPWCDIIFEREKRQTFLSKKSLYTTCSAKCRGSLSRQIQLHGITAKVEKAISENIVTCNDDDNSEQTVDNRMRRDYTPST